MCNVMLQNWSYANHSVKLLKSGTQVEKVSISPQVDSIQLPLPRPELQLVKRKNQHSLSPQSVLNQQPFCYELSSLTTTPRKHDIWSWTFSNGFGHFGKDPDI
jgi:hypothetical protein